jgi:antitoxin CptB
MNVEGAALDGRLVWRCRRGMKELDLVLMRYLRERWATAAADERAQFERILELPDPTLAAYLMGRETPPDPRMQEVLALLARGLPAAS